MAQPCESGIISSDPDDTIPVIGMESMNSTESIHTVHLIVNPHSGYGGSHLLLGNLRSELREGGYELIEHTTRWPKDATKYDLSTATFITPPTNTQRFALRSAVPLR